ncbi:GTPase Era [Bdellovibrio sp. HCB337]|uniref:GTPase Era n=1 Tax=Bdellovibrio sp. HCB337 TaxID=3394358 RepID=UPI0039A6E725
MSYKAGFLGLIGQPNAGKSTLMNYLVREKVSIVTEKPQTTRRRVMGVWSTDEGQIVFVDAPGVIKADKGLNSFLAQEAQDVINSSDAVLAIVSVDEKNADDAEKIIKMVSGSGKPWAGVITKSDIQEKQHRIMILKKMIEEAGGKAFQVTAKDMDADPENREALLIEFLTLLPDSPAPLYDVELFTPHQTRDLVAEIVREKCFEFVHQEIPFTIAVRILKYDEEAKPCPKIYAEILVAKENHKAIVIGKGAENIKNIGMNARKEIESLLGEKVFLDLKVNFKEDWFNNKRIMQELGYVRNNEE